MGSYHALDLEAQDSLQVSKQIPARRRRAARSILNYQKALCAAMQELALDERVVFLGQGVRDAGTFMSTTLTDVVLGKRIELPVVEELQLGMSIGMALAGYVPVSIFPRWQFFLLATNQAVNHLDKMNPHVIVRVGVGSTTPLDPGPQHKGDLTEAFRLLMPNTTIVRLESADRIVLEYRDALKRNGPTVLVEIADMYQAA